MSEREIIGPAAMLGDEPVAVELSGRPYWLVRGPDGAPLLLLALCPHAGGDVLLAGGELYCPLHFWSFDCRTGECMSRDDERLMRRRVALEDGILYATGTDE